MAYEVDEWGGAKVGREYTMSWGVSFPGAHLHATGEQLSIRVLWKRYTFMRAEVSALRRYDGILFWKGIQIIHTKLDYPSYVVFYGGSRREATLEQFRELGYNVLDGIGKESEETS